MRALADGMDASVMDAVRLIRSRPGRLVVTGVGKSGHIAAKLAATFASTGTPSFFLHAAEAAHGDLGMIAPDDVVLAVSNSGNSRELFAILDFCSAHGVPLIGVCTRPESRLGQAARVVLRLPDVAEVCPNNLAPTTSATITLVLGHVLAVLLMDAQAFRDEQFATFHPGGRLGLQLQTVDRYLAEHPAELPAVAPESSMETVIERLTEGRMGCVAVLDDAERLLGIITEGDMRRAYAPDMFERNARAIMTRSPTTVSGEVPMREVIERMKTKRIANVVVTDGQRARAVLHVKDLMQHGYV